VRLGSSHDAFRLVGMATDDPPKRSNFTDEGIQNVSSFLTTLKRIHVRLRIEAQHKECAPSYPLDTPAKGRDCGVVHEPQ